jgi:protein NrfD
LTLFLFLTHLGLGVAFTLLLVSKQAGVKFFRFNAGLAAVLLIIGLASAPPETAAWGLTGRIAAAALGTATALVTLYWVTVGRTLASIRPWILRVMAAAGVVALVAQALALSEGRGQAWQILTAASFLTSSGLLGGACTAMILGHWYLVLPSLDVAHLQSIVRLHIGSTVLRVVVVAAAVAFAIVAWQPGAGPRFDRYVLSLSGVFFWQRALFGLVGPLLLSYLTWETAKIRSTQSATGILYVDFFTVIVGEVLAKYLLLETSVPV